MRLRPFTATHASIILIEELKTLDMQEWSMAGPGFTEVVSLNNISRAP